LIDLIQLRTFVVVAEERHLTGAAERLHISQSAASSQVRALEEELGIQLFLRVHRSMELTRAGQLFLERARMLLGEVTDLASFARGMQGKMDGKLAIGIGGDATGIEVGQLIHELRSRHPLLTTDIWVRPTWSTRQALKSGEIDVGIFLDQPVDESLTYYQLNSVSFCVVGPAAWQKEIETAEWKDLAAMPWVTPAVSAMGYSMMLARLFGDKGLKLNTILRYDNSVVGKSLLKAGVGIMLMREDQALEGSQEGYLTMSPIARTEFPLLIQHLTKRGNDVLIQAFVESALVAWPRMKLIPRLSQ